MSYHYPHPHPQFPAFYAPYPVPVPNQEIYAMYPPGTAPPPMPTYEQVRREKDFYWSFGSLNPLAFYWPLLRLVSGICTAPVSSPLPFPDQIYGGHPSTSPPVRKPGFANRKESTDSGISDYSVVSGATSRKTSSTSVVSNASILEESPLEDVKEEAPYEEPDDDLCEKIATQVEFYFSDANITKDKFLLKHVKRNKEGFVSLKLISSFKRVKHLTKDWRQVAAAIERKSERLEVNDLKTKVRRLDALPEYDETTPSRTVVALNLPLERPTIEGVAEIFSACGDIVLIRQETKEKLVELKISKRGPKM